MRRACLGVAQESYVDKALRSPALNTIFEPIAFSFGGSVTQLDDSASPEVLDVPAPDRRKPWGIVVSILWVVLAFEGVSRVEDHFFTALPFHTSIWHAAVLLAVWGSELLIIVAAVRLRHWPVAEYLGWLRPRIRDIFFGCAVVLLFSLAESGLAYLATGHAFDVAGYRAAVAAGTSPFWYVFQWWPAIFCAPLVEESAIRGFMWRGIEARAGRLAAFLITSLYFASMHYRYFFANGVFFPGTFGIYLVSGMAFGWLRWRSGNTTATIIPHFVGNLYIESAPVIAAAFVA
jgi:membrane protease YdiL (CAAX protease family)